MNIILVCDLQFGSTGKGLIAGYLAEKHAPDTLVSAWSPNAGHTYIDSHGEKFIHTMLPNGVVSPNLKRVMIGPGAILNVESLHDEIKGAAKHLIGTTLYIHGNATIVNQRHRDEEEGPMTKIGSTKKGCGAALIEKIRRQPDARITANQCKHEIMGKLGGLCDRYDITVAIVDRQSTWLRILMMSDQMQIEGAQGYSLGMLSGFYPYTTSRECTPAQICVDCGVPAHWPMTKVGCLRTYPIRVANRYDENGEMVGWSGPHYSDQTEITWDYLGVETEVTTVTKLPRRVFTFSERQVAEAVAMTGVDQLFLNFVNYWDDPDLSSEAKHILAFLNGLTETKLAYMGHGPAAKDVKDYTDGH